MTEFVPAEAAHAPVLAALHEASFTGAAAASWDTASFQALLNRPGAIAVLAVENEAPLGFVLGQAAGGEAEIITLGVLPRARRRGLALCLVEEIVQRSKLVGAEALFLEVAEDNPGAISLYKRAGFFNAGHRKGYYARENSGERADALVMRRDIV